MSKHAMLLPILVCGLFAGCGDKTEWDQFWTDLGNNKNSQPEADPSPESDSDAVRGTIGPLVTIEGLRMTQVRGFGLVVDLVDTGGSDGPELVRKYLVKEVRRRQDVGMPGMPTDELLESPDICMVEVTGYIPAGAKKGDRFDVVIRALGSQAKSLVGGRLVLCDLKMYAETPSGVIDSQTLATANGPVFVSPFDLEGRASDNIDLRTGFVLGGGVVKEPRRIRLVLNDPRYSVAQQIVTRLNGRYGGHEPVAKGTSPSYVDLNVPGQYNNRKRQFLELVTHTTLSSNDSSLQQRAGELVEEINRPDADYESISMAWEAIGKIALPKIRELYASPEPEISYFAGRAGLRLGDNEGMEAVARQALETGSKHRAAAIDELGWAVKIHGAGDQLRKLLDDEDPQVRVQAYLALRRRPTRVIDSKVLDQDNLVLDVINCKGPPLIYVQRLNTPCVALFGKDMRCSPPLIFPGDRNDGRRMVTTISAQPRDRMVTVMFMNKRVGKNSPPLKVSKSVADLVRFLGDTPDSDGKGSVKALAVPYSEIVDILYQLCKTRAIDAKFVVEERTAPDDDDSEGGKERQESEY